MTNPEYIMESPDEALRLDLKADSGILQKHAIWAGIKPGMRVADLGCGQSGQNGQKGLLKYTSLLVLSLCCIFYV